MTKEFHTEVDLKSSLLLAGSAGIFGQIPISKGSGGAPTWQNASLFTPCEILVVGGGGSAPNVTYGTTSGASGGGGGGRVEFCTGINVLRGVALTVAVGAAGNQSAFGPIVATAGSAGGAAAAPGSGGNGNGSATAGSGGGGGTIGQVTTGGIGGTETSTNNNFAINSDTIAQINEYSKAGGGGSAGSSTQRASGGGGGAGSTGGAGVSGTTPGAAGAGLSLSITGSAVLYGAGGAGAITTADTNGANGAANTGNGGGGAARTVAGTSTGGTGGSGIVIIAYPNTYPSPAAISGTYTLPTRSGWRVYQFTGSGSITL